MHATSRGPGPLPEGERAALWHVSCLGAAPSCPAVNATKLGQNRRTELAGLRPAAKSVLFFSDKILAFSANGAAEVAVVGDKTFRPALGWRKAAKPATSPG